MSDSFSTEHSAGGDGLHGTRQAQSDALLDQLLDQLSRRCAASANRPTSNVADDPPIRRPETQAVPSSSGPTDRDPPPAADAGRDQKRLERRLQDFRAAWDARSEPQTLQSIEDRLGRIQELLERHVESPSEHRHSAALRQRKAESEDTETFLDLGDATSGSFAATVDDDESADDGRPMWLLPLRIVLLPDEASLGDSPDGEILPELGQIGESIEELNEAVEERDRYLLYLCGKVREMAIRVKAWLRLLSENTPGEGALIAVHDAQETVRQLLKMAEVERSVELAKIARVQARLKAELNRIQEERQHPQEPSAPCQPCEGQEPDSPMTRRLRRFLKPKG